MGAFVAQDKLYIFGISTNSGFLNKLMSYGTFKEIKTNPHSRRKVCLSSVLRTAEPLYFDPAPAIVKILEDFQMSLQLLPRPRFEPSPLENLCTSGTLYFRDRGRALLHKMLITAMVPAPCPII